MSNENDKADTFMETQHDNYQRYLWQCHIAYMLGNFNEQFLLVFINLKETESSPFSWNRG